MFRDADDIVRVPLCDEEEPVVAIDPTVFPPARSSASRSSRYISRLFLSTTAFGVRTTLLSCTVASRRSPSPYASSRNFQVTLPVEVRSPIVIVFMCLKVILYNFNYNQKDRKVNTL